MACQGLLAVWLILLSIATPSLCNSDTLLVTNVIFRHGDRAAARELPLDRVNESFWQYGWGELTDIGKGQQYRLGRWLRQTYEPILTDIFDYKNIDVRSSDVDRCLVSAYSNLAGLYSDGHTPDLDLPYLRWQPVPVHTQPVVTDEILAMDRPCNKASKSEDEAFDSAAVHQVNKDYATMFTLIATETGLNLSDNAFRYFWPSVDSLYCESLHGLPLPDWTQQTNVTCNDNSYISCQGKTVWQIMKEMEDLQFLVMYNTSVLHKFHGGPLLEDVSNKILQYIAGNRSVRFNMYSAHDTTVAATLFALGVFDNKQPEYTATIMIELHKTDDVQNMYEVKVFYKGITDNDTVTQLELPGCPSPCSHIEFAEMLEKYIIGDWDAACGNTVEPTPPPTNVLGLTQQEIIVISVCTTVVVILLITALLCYINRRRMSSSHSYQAMRL